MIWKLDWCDSGRWRCLLKSCWQAVLESLEAVRRLATWHPGLVLARWVKFKWQSLILLDTAGLFNACGLFCNFMSRHTDRAQQSKFWQTKYWIKYHFRIRLPDILEGVTNQTKNLRSFWHNCPTHQVKLILLLTKLSHFSGPFSYLCSNIPHITTWAQVGRQSTGGWKSRRSISG